MAVNDVSLGYLSLAGNTDIPLHFRYRLLAAAKVLDGDFQVARALMLASVEQKSFLPESEVLEAYKGSLAPCWEDRSGRFSAFPGNPDTPLNPFSSLASPSLDLCKKDDLSELDFTLHQAAINIIQGYFGHAHQDMVVAGYLGAVPQTHATKMDAAPT